MKPLTYLIILAITITYSSSRFPQIMAKLIANSISNISQQHRLDKFIVPESYEVSLKVDVNFNATRIFTIEKCRIKVNINKELVSSNLTKIRLHYAQTAQENIVTIMDKNGKYLPAKMGKPNSHTLIVEIHLINSKLDVENGPYTIEFTNITGTIRDDNIGIFVGDYNYEKRNSLLLAAFCRPINARLIFPCFDEPSMKANFQISLTVPKSFTTVIGNTRTISQENIIGHDLKRVTFEKTPKMSTYQLAFLISTFEKMPCPLNPNFNVYCPNGNAPYVQYAVDVTPSIVQEVEEISKVNYSSLGNIQLSQVALPTTFSTLENAGLILYMDITLYIDVNRSTKEEHQWVFFNIAFSISQLWFSYYVSMEWWSHRWIIEGLATYIGFKVGVKIVPEMELDKLLVIINMKETFEADGTTHSFPLTSKEEDIYNISSIMQQFSAVHITKPPNIIFMMESIMGERNLFRSIEKLLTKYKWGNMNAIKFFEAFESEGLPIHRMKEWTEEAGYPVVTVKRILENAVLSQKRFLQQFSQKSNTKWHIPITYASRTHNIDFANVTPSHWLTPKEDLVIEDAFKGSDWIIVNINQNGYYRVNYEESLWPSILKALNSDNFGGIPAIIRARLIDDVMNMARVMRQSYHLAMHITKYLEKETEYYPWVAAYNAFSYLLKRIGKRTDLKDSLKKYVAYLSTSLSRNLAEQKDSEATYNQVLKKVLNMEWSCDYGYPDNIVELRRTFELYKANPSMAMNPNYQYTMLCYGIKYGNTSDWNFVLEQYKNSTFPIERKRILRALGCSREAATLLRFLEMTLEPTVEIKKHNYIVIFQAVLKSNVDVAQSFVVEYIKEISINYASWNALSIMVKELSDRFTTISQIEEFKMFAQNNQVELREASGDLVQSCIKSAEANVKWLVTFEDELSVWLTQEFENRSQASSMKNNLTNVILLICILIIYLLK